MSLTKCQGIVLKSINLGENDKIITILTDKIGKVDVVVHGAKKTKSKYMACSQPFCYAEYVIYRGKSLYTLNDYNIIESFQSILMDFEKLVYGSFFLELADMVTEKESRNVSILALTLKTLYIMINTDINLKFLKITVGFKAISISGYMPQLYYCMKCKQKIQSGFFSFKDGGLSCENCKPERDFYIINNKTWKYLHIIKNIKLEDLRNINCEEDMLNYLDKLVFNYIKFHLDREFKSMVLLEKL